MVQNFIEEIYQPEDILQRISTFIDIPSDLLELLNQK